MPADAPDASAAGSLRSITVTRKPARASSYAQPAPMAPPPTTTASGRVNASVGRAEGVAMEATGDSACLVGPAPGLHRVTHRLGHPLGLPRIRDGRAHQ